MTAPILFRCPVLDIPQLIPEHDTIIAPSCCRGISMYWPCLPCDAVHIDPLTPRDFDRLAAAGYDFARALDAGVDR